MVYLFNIKIIVVFLNGLLFSYYTINVLEHFSSNLKNERSLSRINL